MEDDCTLIGKQRADISLRLWSDRIAIAPLLERSSFTVEHCHRSGEPIAIHGQVTDRVARRHYASVQNFKTNMTERISDWLADIGKELDANDEILHGLQSGQIEGVVWLAFFGDEVQSLPQIDESILATLAQQHVRFLVENYTDLDADGLPKKTWLKSERCRTCRSI